MSKKLLVNNTPESDYDYVVETMTGNPIYISDLAVTDRQQAEIISFNPSGSTDTITIYSSNCPYIFGKGGRINADS
jgi:hypothetical protein